MQKHYSSFNTFRHQTLLYSAKKDIKQRKGYKMRLDLTKRHYLMHSQANKLAYLIIKTLTSVM